MKMKFNWFYILILFLVTGSAFAQVEQKKLAQTGMKFLNATIDARSAGLSEAVTSMEGGAASMMHNPSTMARQTNFMSASLGHMSFIADIKYYYAAASIAPLEGAYGVIGFSVMGVNYGDLYGTIRANNELGYLPTGIFSPYAYAFGVHYANALSEKFAVGGAIKYVGQDLTSGFTAISNDVITKSSLKKNVLAFDFGLLYKTGFKSLNFGMTVKNFSGEIRYIRDQFQLPLTFRVGLAMNMVDLFPEDIDPSTHKFNLGIDAVHYRDYPEQFNVGGEYIFMDMISLRGGFVFPDEDSEKSYTVGLGLNQNFSGYGIGVDYSYSPYGVFDPVHRLSVMFSL